jgi:hypothetical protein
MAVPEFYHKPKISSLYIILSSGCNMFSTGVKNGGVQLKCSFGANALNTAVVGTEANLEQRLADRLFRAENDQPNCVAL